MRGYAFLAFMVGLLVYVVTRPGMPPPAPATFAPPPAITQVPAKPEPRPEPSRTALANALAPLDIRPQARQLPPRQAAPVSAPSPSPTQSNAKDVAVALTAAAIAALIVAESRRAYHARGRPCACPDDSMRNGRACGGRSAYSRPGGAAPLCYRTDVTETMIKAYRERQLAAR
jgi:hypothetical protein